MLRVTNIEPADRWELGKHKFSPLAKVFNVTAICETDEELIHKHLGKFCIHQVKKGNEYKFQVAYTNILKKSPIKIGDTISLKELKYCGYTKIKRSNFKRAL